MAKKKNKLLEAARQAAQKQYNNTPRQSNSGVTQSMIDNEIKRRDTYAQSQKATAPTAVRGGSGSLGAITKYKATGDPNMYYVDEKRASERMKERGSSSTYNPFQAGSNTRYGAQSSLQKQAEEKQRHGYDVKLKDKTSAGRRRTYSNLDGTQGTYYEKDRFDNPARTTFLLNAVPSRVSNQMMKNPAAKVDTTLARGAKRNTGISLDPSQFMTQESANTLKYDDGKRIEYYERQGNQWVSVPEERYFQTQLLDNGRNPAMYSAADRALDTAKSSWESLKASGGGILTSTDVGRENRGYQLAVEYKDGGVLSPKQEDFMRSTKAGQAVLKGDIQTARTLVNEETRERQLKEQKVLEQQQKSNERAETAKIGAGRAGQFLLDLEGTALDMAPGMALNAVAPGSFLVEMAFQSYGNSYNNARLQGASHDEAVLSGLQNAAVETLSEMMFAGGKTLGRMTGVRGIFRPGKEIEEASLGFIKSTAGRDIITTVKKLGLASAEEGAEELVAGLVEPMLDAMIYQDGLENLDWEQTLHDALYNTLVGAAMGGGFGTVDVAQSIAAGSNIRANADVANMINQGLAMPEDSKAYMIARKLDAQYKADPDTLGNIDVSELNRALQEEWQNVQKTHSKEMSTARAALAREGISNLDTHAEEDYVRSRRTDAQDDVTAEEAAYSHSELGDRFGATYEQASEMIRASGAEMSQIETERAAASIARIMYGEGTAADTANLMASNPVAREVFQEISGKALPADNAGAMRELEKFNTTNKIRYATEAAKINQEQDRKRRMSYVMEDARNLLGRSNPAVDTFHEIAKDTETENLDAAEEAFIRLYDLGNSGAAFVPNLEMAGMLPEEAQRAAYDAGAQARMQGFEDAQAALARADAKSKEEGKKTKKGENDVQQKLDEEEAKTAKKEGYTNVAQELQKALGVKIVLETKRSIAGRDLSVNASLVNGWYSNGVIHLNIEGVDSMEVVFSHEFTHHLERYAPKEYQALIDFIKQEKTNNNEQAWQREIDAKMEQYARAGKKLKSRDDAVREIVADMAYEFLTDERTVHRLFGYDKDLATKIQQTILDVIDRMLKVLRDETRIRGTQWEGMQKQFEEAREMWITAAEVARGNADLDIGGETQFDIQKKEYHSDAQRKIIDEYNAAVDDELLNLFERIEAGEDVGREKVTVGVVSEKAAADILANVPDVYKEGFNPKGYKIRVGKGFYLHVEKDHGKHGRADHSMENNEDKARVGYVANNYDDIEPGDRSRENKMVDKNGRTIQSPTVVLSKRINGTAYVIEAVPDTAAKEIVIISAYMKKEGPQMPDVNSPGVTSKNVSYAPSNNNVQDAEQSRNQNTQKEQGPFSLADIGMTEKNGKAAWLPERIDRLIRQSGAESIPEYAKEYAVMMSPRDFLKLTASDETVEDWSRRAQNVPNEVKGMPYREAVNSVWNRAKETGEWIHDNENYPLDQEELARQEQTPFLIIDAYDNTQIVGHEGRHRMRALMEAGITSVPVVINDTTSKYSKQNLSSMTLMAQNFGNGPVNGGASVVVHDLVPINEAHRAELEEKFGAKGDEQVQFSIAEDSKGRKLSKGQQEYFKNSKARDAEGRLVPVYHSTEYGGFTIFDPNASDDGRSLFFTSNRNMSESYTKKKGMEINPYEVGNQTPLEEAYDLDEAIERLREVEERGIAYVEVRVPANEEETDGRNHYAEIMHPGPDEILLDYMTLSDYLTDYPLSEFPDGPEGMRLMIRDSKTDWIHADMRNLSDLADGYNDYVADYNFDSNVDPYESRGIQGTYSSYLNLENPLIIDAAGQRWDSFSNNGVTIRSYIVQEDENGREGVTLFLYDDEYDGGEFYTFEELKNRFSVPQNEIDSMLDEGHGEIGLRNNQYYDLEENGFPEMGNTRSWSEYAAENGYDGVIIRNLHDNGVYGVSNEAGDVYIAFSSNQVKDIRNENPTDDPDIRFSFAGENALNANNMMLAIAKQWEEEGRSSEEIRQFTGWHKGYEGRWRFEIDDSQAELDTNLEHWKKYDQAKAIQNYRVGRPAVASLDEFLKHDALFANYPSLRNFRLDFKKGGKRGNSITYGEFDPYTRTLTIYEACFKTGDVKSTVMHEIQHAIQKLERFANGSNPANMTKGRSVPKKVKEGLLRALGEANDLLRARAKETEEFVPVSVGIDGLEEYRPMLMMRAAAEGDYELIEALNKFREELDKYEKAQQNTKFGRYERAAGEIEARDVQARLDLTEEQRRARRPDIDRADALLTDDYGNSLIEASTKQELNDLGVDTTEGGTAVKYSLASWNDTDKGRLIEALVKAGHDRNAAQKWVNDVNSVAAIILGDMKRLNYEADQFQDALKNNEEYYYTLDLSTLCQKRRLYQGTYNAIMHQIVNRGLMPQDTVRLREMMKEMGFEAPCGICYEESRKKNEGKFAERWLEKYNSESHDDPYRPTLADVTTTDGRAALRKNHPEIHDSYLAYQRTRGSANPKVSFTHTDYRQDILRMTDGDVRKVKHIGGLRIQSFSDFETIHVIDMMQAVLDMATRNLTAQAYTKVPAFADIFGGTGIKINLSLIGQVKNGELWFDPVEGIDPDEAFRIREKYSDNVGTILVGANTESILAAWKDPRIDMVIPFHRSGWSKSEFEKLGLGDYEDFQAYQSERYLDGSSPDGVALSKVKMEGIYPSDYWDYSKTGKENAEAYLRLCAEKHYRPVFYNFLQDNGDGTWSLKDDGSTDGYWKSLIDYKMYNNEGVGAPQREVWPNFDMEVAEQTMAQYEGNADTLPVAQEVVDRFLEEYKAANPDVRFSLSEDTEGRALTAAQQSFFKDSKIRDEQGRLKVMYHGTDNEFTVFNFDQGGKNGTAEGFGIYTADDRNVSENYGGRMIEGYVNMTRPAYRDQKTITRSELKKLIKATIDYEVGLWEMDERDSWISNYTDTYSAGSMDTAINDVVAQIVRFNDNDMDIVQEVMAGMAIREYPQAEAFYDILTDVTGIDGFVTNWTDHTTGESSQIALAFRSNQIKNVTNENPTEDPDIRYSIQSSPEGDGNTQLSLASDRDMEIADLRKKVERLQRDKKRTYGREASDADARRVARALLADTSSDFSLNQTIKAVKELFTMIKRGDDFADIYGYVQGIARSIADSSYDMVEIPGASDLADLRQRFLDTRKRQNGSPLKIMIPQNLIGDFDRVGGWKEFRKAHKGIVTLSVNSGESYDSFVEGIAEEFGEQYRVEGDNSGIDSLIAIIEAADSQEARNPVRKTYRDEDTDGSVPDDVDMGVMGGWRDTEVNSIIDRLLDDVAEQIAPDLTFADRKAEEKDAAVKKERAKWEARREQWRAERDKRIAEMKEDKKLAVEAQRAKGEERLRKQAEFYRRQRERSRERRADRESRRKTLARIYKTTQRLSQKLLKPTDSQHIPEKYRAAVADMLGWLDFENARTDAWARRHGDVPSARILNLRKLKDIYAEIANDESLNQFIEPDDQIKEWIDLLSDVEGTRLDDLTTEQLRAVRLILDAVSWQVNNADKALTEGLKQSRAEMATELMDELEAQKGEKLKDGVIKKFLKSDATPVHFFDRLGLNVFKKLWQQLTLAQDTHIRHLSEAQEYIEKNITSKWGNTAKVGNNSLIKKWTEESEKYELENGKMVEMTGAQVMSLYALNKREQARKHLLGGGIVIAPTKVKRDLKGGVKEYLLNRELQKTRAELTYKDIANILSKMSQEQKDAADAMLKYLKITSEWGNETSMKLYGYRKFTEDNYFPIQSAKEFIAGSNLELQRDKKIKNQGMTKNVNEYANNPIVIDDFFEVTTAHINQMSQYNSFVPILEDFDKIYQYSEYDPETQKYHRSVKELIEQKHGRWAADYIETLLKNVNGNYGNEVADIQGFDKLLRNWKAAKIGLSVRVLAQQPTAVVRAFNEIGPKYFVGTPRRGSHKRMWEICPIAEWKNWGYSQTDIHRSMRDTMMGDKHLTDKLFFDMYGRADNFGWGVIFDAVERETKDLMKKGRLKFEFDSAEYRQHVNERFREIVDRTQVVDSVLHRSQLMRSQNTLTKAMTSFMAEPTISINTIMTAFSKAQEEARAGHKGAAAKAATRGITVFVANAVAVSAAASLISAIRESYLPDDDDEEEKELSAIQQWLVDHGVEEGSLLYSWMTGYFIEDFKDNINPLMLVPVTKDMLNMLQGYEAPNPMYQLPQSLIQNAQNMKKWIDEDGDTRYSGRYYIERAAESVAELFGVPAANIRKELIGIQNIYFRAISEKEYGDYLQDRWELNEDYKSNKNIFIDHYLNAKKAGHDESAKDIREQLLKSKVKDEDGNLVFTDEAIQKRAWSVYAPNFKDDVIAGRDVSKQEKDLKSVGITAEDIDDKKSKALVSSISDAVEMGDTNRLEDLYGVLEKYGYGEYDVDKKVKSAASDLMYDAIDAENYDDAENYITIITDVTGYTRDDVVSSITTHYMSSYYDAMDAGDQAGVSRVTSILGRYGVTSNAIHEKEAEHYKDYYRQKAYMAYSSGNTAEAYRIATEYNAKYPGTYAKGADGMMYGLQNLSQETIRRYNTSGKYAEWQLP